MSESLLVGAAEVEITPPLGTSLCGSATGKRHAAGVEDPLTAKAIVLESGGTRLAYVLLDLIALPRSVGDPAVELAAERTGIPPQNIVWAASHTHTGPYTCPLMAVDEKEIDSQWLEALPGKFAEAVEKAQTGLRPARVSRERGYCADVGANRRYKFKDGRELNAWLLHGGEEEVQCLGTAGPIDPELGILCFDDESGRPIAVLWHYTLHTNANFGRRFSADYPGVVAERLRERLGPGVVPVFLPGAFADINPTCNHREVGDRLAEVLLDRLEQRQPRDGAVSLGTLKKDVVVPYRDLAEDMEKRLSDSQWPPDAQEVFRKELGIMRARAVTEEKTVIQAWRIGEVGFTSLPGELFVDWGLKIKAESPFPWTFPVELGGDYLGYLVTEQAWEAGGYESLTCRSARPSVEGVAGMVEVALRLLSRLWAGKVPV